MNIIFIHSRCHINTLSRAIFFFFGGEKYESINIAHYMCNNHGMGVESSQSDFYLLILLSQSVQAGIQCVNKWPPSIRREQELIFHSHYMSTANATSVYPKADPLQAKEAVPNWGITDCAVKRKKAWWATHWLNSCAWQGHTVLLLRSEHTSFHWPKQVQAYPWVHQERDIEWETIKRKPNFASINIVLDTY